MCKVYLLFKNAVVVLKYTGYTASPKQVLSYMRRSITFYLLDALRLLVVNVLRSYLFILLFMNFLNSQYACRTLYSEKLYDVIFTELIRYYGSQFLTHFITSRL